MIEDAAALTGDFLFVDSIGRPDLAGKTEEWTLQLWDSVVAAKETWSPNATVLPAHYASEAERRQDRVIGALFGELTTRNEPLAITERDDFRDWVRSRAASFPEAYRKIKAVNVGLLRVDEAQAEELEIGKNECALGGAS
jgi:glyoxylase-like metal-dependent hydrolase (beta-lactamase superfamily II)